MDCLTVIFFSINQHNHCTASSSKPSVYTTSYIVCSMILINFGDSNSKVRLISLHISLSLSLSLPFPSLFPSFPLPLCVSAELWLCVTQSGRPSSSASAQHLVTPTQHSHRLSTGSDISLEMSGETRGHKTIWDDGDTQKNGTDNKDTEL